MVREREAACWMEKREVSMQKQEEIPGRWKSQREVSNVQYDPDPVEHAMEGKKRFLVVGIFRRRPIPPNTLLSMVRNICPPLAVLPQLVAILLYTAGRLSLDSVASTPPVVPSFLAPFLCAAISCGDVSNVFKATQLATIH